MVFEFSPSLFNFLGFDMVFSFLLFFILFFILISLSFLFFVFCYFIGFGMEGERWN